MKNYFIFTILLYISSSSFSQTISFTLNNDSNIVIKGKFNDTVAANLVFDTGGGLNVVSNKFFQKIKNGASFKHFFTGFRHDGERLDFEVYEISSLTIGDYKIKNLLVGVASLLDQWNMDGVVSLVNFKKKPVTIDYERKQLRFESNSSMRKIATLGISLTIKTHEYTDISLDVFVPVCIGSSTLDMEFDTGSSPSDVIINSKFIRALQIDTTSSVNKTFYTPFSQKPYRHYLSTLNDLNFCGLPGKPLYNVAAAFKENMIHDGIIGAGYFLHTPITIDIFNKRILVHHK